MFVFPQENIVIVFTGALEVGKEGILLYIINDYIVPSVRSQSAIPSNPEARENLVCKSVNSHSVTGKFRTP